jgi:biotin synthase
MSCFRSSFHAAIRLSPASRQHPVSARRALSTIQDAPILNTSFPVQATQSTPLQDAVKASGPRMTWTKEEITQIYNTSLMELQYAAVSHTMQ